MQTSLLSVILAVGLTLAGCGDDSELCRDLTEGLLESIRTACPTTDLGCGGNPNLDKPVAPYAIEHFQTLERLKDLGCAVPDLGSAPLLCNAGSPACPTGYICCAGACRRACTSGS